MYVPVAWVEMVAARKDNASFTACPVGSLSLARIKMLKAAAKMSFGRVVVTETPEYGRKATIRWWNKKRKTATDGDGC